MTFFRKTYWYASAFFKKRWKLVLGVVFVSIVLFPTVFGGLITFLRLKKTTFIGRIGSVSLATLPRDIQEKMSDGLTRVDERGVVLPALAERWSVEDGGKTYRFILKQRVSWQDGKEVKAEDMKYNFSDVQIIPTQNEVIFKLKDAFVPFPAVVSQPVFRQNKSRVIGTGEFRMVKIKKEGANISEVQLESSREKLVYRFYPTESSAITAFKTGAVDVLEDMTGTGDLAQWKTVKTTPVIRKDRYLAVFFNMDHPLFEKNVRQALNYALPKRGGEERATNPIHPGSWAFNKTVKTYDEDNGRAVELLLKSVPQSPINIELTTTVNFQDEAEEIKREWEAVGNDAANACKRSKELAKKVECTNFALTVSLRVTNFPDLSNFQAMVIAQQIPKDPDQYFLWHSTQSTNFMHYKSPRIDKLLEDGRKEQDKDQRTAIYQDFQQFLVEDSPAIFLTHPTEFTIERK